MNAERDKRGEWFDGARYAEDLSRLAQKALEQAEARSDPSLRAWDTAVPAIVFAAASLEGFINEVIYLAEKEPGRSPVAVALASVSDESVIGPQAPIRLKFSLAKFVLSGKPYRRGEDPYQSFDLLIKLRDSLVHLRPLTEWYGDPRTSIEAVHPKTLLKRLKDLGLVPFGPETTDTQTRDWTDLLFSPATERWACQTAREMVLTIIPEDDRARDGSSDSFHETLRFFYPSRTGLFGG